MAKTKHIEYTETITPTLDAKDEMNLAEFPIALLTDRPPTDRASLVYQDTILDSGSNKPITRTLTITAPAEYGLPRGIDEDVIVALVQLTKIKNGFTSRKVRFTRSELIDLLGWPYNGKSYDRLTASLYRWTAATLAYENAWWLKNERRWTSKIFHIIDECEINDSRSTTNQQELLTSEVTWNETVFLSFASGNLRDLDYRLYLGLEHATSKRMFRFLDKRFYHGSPLSFDLNDFAFAHIGLSPSYGKNVAKIKEKLANAIEELTGVGFIAPRDDGDRYVKEPKGWRVIFERASAVISSETSPSDEQPLPLQFPAIVQELIRRGVSPDAAAKVEATCPIEDIRFQIEHFDWLEATKHKNYPENPGGWFVRAIPGKFKPPRKFRTKAQIQEAEEAKREKARQAKAAKDRQSEKEAEEARAHQARTAAVEAYFAGLTPEALEQLDLDFQADGGFGPGKFPFKQELFKGFVARKLGLLD